MVTNSEDKNSLKTKNGSDGHSRATCVSVNAGICGFTCRIKAWKIDKKTVGLEISESECQQIQDYSELIRQLTLNEVFLPATRNPVYLAADQAGFHPSCPVPAAVLKAAEVAMEMALERDATIRFEPCKGGEV
jgi:hypothetical protein